MIDWVSLTRMIWQKLSAAKNKTLPLRALDSGRRNNNKAPQLLKSCVVKGVGSVNARWLSVASGTV